MTAIEPLGEGEFRGVLDSITAALDGHNIVSVAATLVTMLSIIAIDAGMSAEKDAGLVDMVARMLADSLPSVRAQADQVRH